VGIAFGIVGGSVTLFDIRDNGLPRYTKVADKDSTGILRSNLAYGVATMTTATTVGIVTAIVWPLPLCYAIGMNAKK